MMIAGFQIRAARSVLGWSIADLSRVSGIGTTTIKRYEAAYDLSSALPHYVTQLIKVFGNEGVFFEINNTQGLGIFYKCHHEDSKQLKKGL